jgi:hypothetical protein
MRRPVLRGRRSATRTRGRVARPGRSSIPAALMGFIPSQCCSCPRGFEALSASGIPLAVSPASAPIIFVGGSAVPSRLDLRSCHPRLVERQPIERRSPRLLGFVLRGQSVPRTRISSFATRPWPRLPWDLPLSGFRHAYSIARTGSAPRRAIGLRRSASGSYPLVGLTVTTWRECSRTRAVTHILPVTTAPCSVLMRPMPSRSANLFESIAGPAPCLRFVHLPSESVFSLRHRRGAQPK